jgi:RHH-type proline utilization regulon transcriptional repressor/proline dehydrogenase/delta 1-pyrroline-5-carboxylate dehydrogenase
LTIPLGNSGIASIIFTNSAVAPGVTLDGLMTDPALRVQVLRFVDVLPTLDDDAELARHLVEYFDTPTPAIPGLLRAALRRLGRGGRPPAWLAALVRAGVRRLASRFMAGADAQAAGAAVAKLFARGLGASLDLLGEAVVSESEAEHYQACYLKLLDGLAGVAEHWPRAPLLDRRGGRTYPRLHVSVKLSSLYSQATPRDPEGSADRIAQRLRPILEKARQRDVFVCVDMEQYELKDITLLCFKRVLADPALRHWPNVGIALQAYLRDTEADLLNLIEWARARGTPVTVRLVRGAYWDYEMIVARREGQDRLDAFGR